MFFECKNKKRCWLWKEPQQSCMLGGGEGIELSHYFKSVVHKEHHTTPFWLVLGSYSCWFCGVEHVHTKQRTISCVWKLEAQVCNRSFSSLGMQLPKTQTKHWISTPSLYNKGIIISPGPKMVMNSFGNRNFMQPMGRLSMHSKCLDVFFFKVLEGVPRIFFSFLPCSQHVPYVFPKGVPHSTSL